MNEPKVKLIAYTQWNHKPQNSEAEDIISYCARVSNPTNQDNFETSERLLSYCIKNQHWSVFEMSNAVIEIETTRDIARQILRHRSFSFQEFSTRYANPVEGLGFTTREARLQDTKNRQNSYEVHDPWIKDQFIAKQKEVIKLVTENYEWAIKNGIAKEQARALLPEGLTKSRMYMNGNLRSWLHYCSLRLGNGTQKEHRIVADYCWRELKTIYPFLSNIDVKIHT